MKKESDMPNMKIIIVISDKLGKGQVANRAAVLATGLTAHIPNIIGENTITLDNKPVLGFTQIPIPILVAKENISLRELAKNSQQKDCTTLIFLSRAQGMRSYQEYIDSIQQTLSSDLDIDAVAIAGNEKIVTKLTGNLPMLR